MAYLKKLYAAFTSRRTTIYLIAILAGLYCLGLIIPQRFLLSPDQYAAWEARWPALVTLLAKAGLTRLYASPLVSALTALFFLNLVLVTVKRIPVVLRSVRLPSLSQLSEAVVQQMPVRETLVLQDPARIETLRARLRAAGFRLVSGAACLQGVKNRYSPVGSLFFHVSFVFFLAGGLFLFHSRFRGETFVTEGQVFNGTRPEYRAVFRLSEMRKTLPELRFIVDKIKPRFHGREPVSLETWVTAEGGGARRSVPIDVNRPLRLGSTSVLVTDVGIAPFVQVLDRTGRELLGAFVALNIYRGEQDHFAVPDTDYTVWVRFWPDAAVDASGNRYTRSYDLLNPQYAIEVRSMQRTIASGTLTAPTESVRFDGNQLFIRDMRYYGGFLVVDERGGGLLITGFIVAVMSLMFKFLWPKREVLAVWGEDKGKTVLHIGYQVEYQKSMGRQDLDRILLEVR